MNTDSFTGLDRSLIRLNLNGIGLATFPIEIAASFRKLRQIELDDNKITSLSADLLKDFLTTFQKFRISLKNNRLTTIDPRAFSIARLRLESVDLQNNKLTSIGFLADPCSLAFTLKSYVNVQHNRINCDCDTYSVIVTEYVHIGGRCAKPSRYSGYLLNPLIDSRFEIEAASECSHVNITSVVTCERDYTSDGYKSSVTVTL